MRAVRSASVPLRGSPHSQANLWSNEDKQIAKACHPGHTCQKEMMASSCCSKARTYNKKNSTSSACSRFPTCSAHNG